MGSDGKWDDNHYDDNCGYDYDYNNYYNDYNYYNYYNDYNNYYYVGYIDYKDYYNYNYKADISNFEGGAK
jgi:hypothetical protein